ncbi:MAG: hypothetical protein P8J17_16840 [Halioglobus sp.]|nr:hypothetical protein [Halioglobus sp.]
MSWLRAIKDRYRVGIDPLRTERRIEVVVILLLLVLLLQLAYGAARLAILSTPAPILPATDSLEVMSSIPRGKVTARQRSEIRSRPLFWTSRRPADAVANAAELQELKELKEHTFEGIRLLGVFGAGESVGIIAQVKGKPRRVLLGEKIDGWTLEAVAGNDAVFVAGSRREKATLQPETVKSAVQTRNPRARRGR